MKRRDVGSPPWPHEGRLPPWVIVEMVRDNFKWNARTLEKLKLARLSIQDARQNEVSAFARIPGHMLSTVQSMWRDWASISLWDQRRQVFVVHPAFTRTVLLRAGSDEFPSSVFRNVRGHNPMMVFPEGIPITLSDGSDGLIRMFTVSGFQSQDRYVGRNLGNPRRIIDSDRADTDGLSVHAMIECLNKDHSQVTGVIFSHLAVALDDKMVSMASLRDRAIGNFDAGDTGQSHVRQYLTDLYGAVLPHLLYAASEQADIGEPDRDVAGGSAGRGAGTGASLSYYPVGYSLGTAIEAYERQEHEARERGEPTGRTVRPHWRRPHMHTYWTGPGRGTAIVKLLAAVEVNADKTGPEGHNVTLRRMGRA